MRRLRNACALLLLAPLFLAATPSQQSPKSGGGAAGKKLYNNQCALCHGIEGTGGKGPALNQPKLRHAPTQTALLKVIQQGIPGTEMPDFWALSDTEARQVAAYVRSLGRLKPVKLPGNVARGQKLFETKGNCLACHVVQGTGGVSGPELTDIGLRRGAEHLRQAVLEPNAATPEGFLVVTVTTAAGQRLRGVRLNEDPFTIQLRDASSRLHSFRKAELQEVKKELGASTMPSYKETFTAAELDDLVAYLASLRGGK